MFTILGVFDLLTRLPLSGVSIETRGPASVRSLGSNRFEIEGAPDSIIRVDAPGHIPQFRFVSASNIGEGMVLRPTSVLPRPIRGGWRLLWTELGSTLPDWDLALPVRTTLPPGLFSPITLFDLTTSPGIWWKAVKVFDRTGRQLQDLQSEEGRRVGGTTRVFTMSALMGGTLVLAKAKFLGFHTDMYEVGLDATSLPLILNSLWTFNWTRQ